MAVSKPEFEELRDLAAPLGLVDLAESMVFLGKRRLLVPVPLTLVSQYLPVQYAAIREGRLKNEPREIVLDGVEQVLRHYDHACRSAGAAGSTVADLRSE